MRVRRYSKSHPEGKLFTDKAKLQEAEKTEEWFDAKWKVNGIVPEDLKGKIEWPPPPQHKKVEEYIPEVKATEKLCECGCGTPVNKRFAPGHYFKMRAKHGDFKNYKPSD